MAKRVQQIKQPWQDWVSVKWKAGTPESAWKQWSKDRNIKNAWSTTGNWDCSLWVDFKNPDDLEQFVWKKIRTNKWVLDTETHWVKQWW